MGGPMSWDRCLASSLCRYIRSTKLLIFTIKVRNIFFWTCYSVLSSTLCENSGTWSWSSYGSWIITTYVTSAYHHLTWVQILLGRDVLDATLCHTVRQWFFLSSCPFYLAMVVVSVLGFWLLIWHLQTLLNGRTLAWVKEMDTNNKLVKICEISSKNQASPRSKNWHKCVPGFVICTMALLYLRSTGGGGGMLFYLCRPKICFVAFFSAIIDDRNLILGH